MVRGMTVWHVLLIVMRHDLRAACGGPDHGQMHRKRRHGRKGHPGKDHQERNDARHVKELARPSWQINGTLSGA